MSASALARLLPVSRQAIGKHLEVLRDRAVVATDMSFTITDRAVGSSDEHYDIEISYATDLFDESTAQAIGGYLLTMLDGMVSDPAKPIARIDLLSGDQTGTRCDGGNR